MSDPDNLSPKARLLLRDERGFAIETALRGLISSVQDTLDRGGSRLLAANRHQLQDAVEQGWDAIDLPEPDRRAQIVDLISPPPVSHIRSDDVVKLLERAMEDARSGRLKALALGGIGADEHVTAYTFDDDQPGLRELLAGAMLLVSQQIASGEHETLG